MAETDGFLYKYVLSNGRIYIGRDRNEDDCYKRAKDHLYNALAYGYGFWSPNLYHKDESKNSFYMVLSNPQFMEQTWGRLISRNNKWEDLLIGINNEKYTHFQKIFLDSHIQQYIDSEKTIQAKKTYNSELQSVKKIIQNKKEQKIKLTQDEKDINKMKELTIYDKSNSGYIIGLPPGIKQQWYDSLFTDNAKKEADFKANLTQKLQILSWQIKKFNENDSFWWFTLNNEREPNAKRQNIVTSIQHIANSSSLIGVNLAEFLLIGLSISTPEGLSYSLNKDIGNYQKAFENIVNYYGIQNLLNFIADNEQEENALIQEIQYNILTHNQKTFDVITNEINNIIVHGSKTNKNIKTETEASVQATTIDGININLLINAWFQQHLNQDYWANRPNQVQEMLEVSFKYSLLIKNLFEQKSIEPEFINAVKNIETKIEKLNNNKFD